MDTVLFWQPWSAAIDEHSAAVLGEALAGGRGVLLSACHQGPYYRSMYALPQMRDAHYSVAGPWLFERPSHDYWGRRMARWRKAMVGRPVPARGSYLAARAHCSNAASAYTCSTTCPARTRPTSSPRRRCSPTEARGWPSRPTRSWSRCAHDAAARVCGSTPCPRSIHASFAGVDELHDALADSHERWILEEPAAMADPNGFGWENGATARGWSRP